MVQRNNVQFPVAAVRPYAIIQHVWQVAVSNIRAVFHLFVAFAAAASLAGCAIQLAPDYDAQMLDGLVSANKEALVLFAKVEQGSEKSKFVQMSDEYAGVIASFEALRQRAKARQIPPLTNRLAKMKFFAQFCDANNDPGSCLNATSSSLTEIVSGLRMLRNSHCGDGKADDRPPGGLSVERVSFIRGRYDIQIDQVLTVETALKR